MNKIFFDTLRHVKQASYVLGLATPIQKNKVIAQLAKEMRRNKKAILRANAIDVSRMKKTDPLYDRLLLTGKRIDEMIQSALAVCSLEDPVGHGMTKKKLANGLLVERRRVPFGVIGVIYESRPNVTTEVATLCIKTGNAVVLRGGSEAFATNQILTKLIQRSLEKNGFSKETVYLVDPRKRNLVHDMLHAEGLIDCVIPRGGAGLISWVRKNSWVPTIETGAGVCHTYVEKSAKLDNAARIIVNAKTQRPSVCNALDTLVVDSAIVDQLVKQLVKPLREFGVKIFADKKSFFCFRKVYPRNLLFRAQPKHFGHEFLSLQMSVKTVSGFEQGLAFVADHTSGHSESIITENKKFADSFLRSVDAACVYANASTRFTDGFQFGLGAEVGISTQKLHARGPMGLEELTTYKWVIHGSGQVRK